MMHERIAAIDLGSNSFRLQVGRIVQDQIYPLDGLKESVRLAAGLLPDRRLDLASRARAVAALSRFRERLADFPPDSVRAVATNTLRVAKNAPEFLIEAENALGFPIEVIAGREEARLIYVGVAHSLPDPHRQSLVVDIGGGSTEFVIGQSFKPVLLESLYMGCVSYSLRYFSSGLIEKRALREAELAAGREIQAIVRAYRNAGWEMAVGSSGTAKALSEILKENGWAEGDITREGLARLRAALLEAGQLSRLSLNGLRPDRFPVLLGGFAIMSAVFAEFELERMLFSEGALRLGVMYDLLGRYHHHDLRDATVQAFVNRYEIDLRHATDVARTAQHLLTQLEPPAHDEEHPDHRFLGWAALLHEVGISVAHSSYHKHSAYILGHADMPGFSRMDQARLARIVLAHRGKLTRVAAIEPSSTDWLLIACLRLAVLLHRPRDGRGVPPLRISSIQNGFALESPPDWLACFPLTARSLEEEALQWQSIGWVLRLESEGS